jgi:putative peptidoglycan lipid II flippase
VVLTKIFLLSPVIFTVSNVFGSILNSQKKFLIANLAPVLYNCGIIFGLLVLYPAWGLQGLGWGVILGALLHLLVQILESVRFGYAWQPIMDFKDLAVRKIGKLFIPRIFGLDTSQLSLLIGSVIGSFLAAGSIAVLNLANNLQAVPVGIFAISVAIAAFPALSEAFAIKDLPGFVKILKNSIIQILFFIIPISILMLLFRAYLVRLVYGAGKFSWSNTILTFNTLGVFVFALFSQALLPLLARAFYARQNTKIPVLVGLICMGLNIWLSYIFALHALTLKINLPPLHFSLQTGGVVGIALGFTLASIINALALFVILRYQLAKDLSAAPEVMENFDLKLIEAVLKILLASIAMGIVGYLAIYLLAPLVNTRTGLGILIQSGLACLLAICAFLAVAVKLKLKEATSVLISIKKIIRLS